VIGLLRRGLSALERPLPSLGLRGMRPAQWLHALWAWWLRLSDADVFALAIITFVSLTDDPLMEALRLGQASMIVFALIAVAFWLLRRELPFALGLVLAVAVMVKALPLVLVVYFILRMRWRVVLGALVGGLLLLGGMALVVGPQGLAAMRAIVGNGVGDSMRYLSGARRPLPSGRGMKGPLPLPVVPAGARRVPSHRANSIVFGRSVVKRSHGEKHARAVDAVLVRKARAAHATSLVWNETTRMAVGRHRLGARP
jgi:hypothetical protein